MYTIFTTEGSKVQVEKLSFKDLQRIVGGYVELINITKDLYMAVNSDGLIQNLPLNERAINFAKCSPTLSRVKIVGNAIVFNKSLMKDTEDENEEQ